MTIAAERIVGRPLPLIDGIEKVTGRARYTADLPAEALVGRIDGSPTVLLSHYPDYFELAARRGVNARDTRAGSGGFLPISASIPDGPSRVLGRSAGSGELRDAKSGCVPPFGASSSVNGLAEVWSNITESPAFARYATNVVRKVGLALWFQHQDQTLLP